MIRLLADEDLNRAIVRGAKLRSSTLDFILVDDVELLGAPDPTILIWAASNQRIVVSHDCNTMIGHARELQAAGQAMAGLFIVRQTANLGRVIDDLLFVHENSETDVWSERIEFFPFS